MASLGPHMGVNASMGSKSSASVTRATEFGAAAPPVPRLPSILRCTRCSQSSAHFVKIAEVHTCLHVMPGRGCIHRLE